MQMKDRLRDISLTELIHRICDKYCFKNGELMLDIRKSPYVQAKKKYIFKEKAGVFYLDRPFNK